MWKGRELFPQILEYSFWFPFCNVFSYEAEMATSIKAWVLVLCFEGQFAAEEF